MSDTAACEQQIAKKSQPILSDCSPFREDATEKSINDEGKANQQRTNASHRRPLLTLQLLAAVLIVLTMPESSAAPQPNKPTTPEESEPFELADGNTYVEHAGMAVEADRIRSFKSVF